MRPYYLNGMLRSLVFALVGIFTPVYIYQLLGLWPVLGYYALLRLTTLVTVLPIARIIERIGFRRSIAVSIIFLAGSLAGLLGATQDVRYLVVAAMLSGINVGFYWVARNSAVAQDSQARRVGSQMGIMTSVEAGATVLGPLTAGLVIERWGFPALYTLAIVILVISVIPLWGMHAHVHRNGASWRGFWRWVGSRGYFHNAVGIAGRAVDEYAIAVLWPLAVYLLNIRVGVVGGIFSTVAIVGLAVRLVTGIIFDRLRVRRDWSDEWLYGLSVTGSSILWLMRLGVSSVGAVLGVDLAGAIFGTTYSSLAVDYQQLGGKRMGSIAYWVYGEMVASAAILVWLGVVAVGAWVGAWREVILITASLWVLISITLARESNMK